MTPKSRTEYSARNTTVAVVARVTAILMGYVTRVVFTHTLSADYVGINGLFKDILNVLALSELGVETAITYVLYKPISEGDIEKQKSLMQLYKFFYRIVAGFILVAGLLIIPFMDVLIKDQPDVEHLIFIYLMYLFNSVLSYLLVYKRTLIDAHQLSYIGVLYSTVFLLLQDVVQIIVLLTTRNFILFLAILLICTIANNICISCRADKMYPYLKDKNVQKLSKEERQEIVQNIRAMMMHKIGAVVVNNTDNLLLSALVGTLSVGRYSNYYLIIGSARQVLEQFFRGITASVGNMGVEENKERVKKIFETSFFIGQWLYGLVAICLYEIIDVFVGWSFGEQYVFTGNVTLILCLNFYLTGMRQATLVFRDSMGLFRYDRYKAIAEAVINLVVSLILGHYMGTAGVFLGTIISTITTSLWVEPLMLYRHKLQEPCRKYFLKYALYAGVTFLLWYGVDMLCRQISGTPWTVCILRLLVCMVIINPIYLILYHRTREFRLLWNKAMYLLRKYFKKDESETEQDISAEEKYLFTLLRRSLTGGCSETEKAQSEDVSEADWDKLVYMAKQHSVLSLLYEELAADERVTGEARKQLELVSRSITQQSYRLLFLSKYLTEELAKAGIPVAVLKGVATAGFFPTPELRKSGDVDLLLLDESKLEEAKKIIASTGAMEEPVQPAHHHVNYGTKEGIELELHTMLAEPFDNDKMNRYIESLLGDCKEHVAYQDVMGVKLPMLTGAYHAYELLLHMLQHFLRSGFGLKLLCDWVVFWNREQGGEEEVLYVRLVEESGVKGFSDMITMVCCRYMGLDEKKVEFMNLPTDYDVAGFAREILEAEEFGKSSKERMVTLRGTSFIDYVREFHHQMHLNFPKAGRVFLLWPVLWMITLACFLRNNRKIRGVSGMAVLKKAGQRSKYMEQMKLFK